MQLLRSILVMATLALWLAGANHCLIEQWPGMAFLACAEVACAEACPDSDCAGHQDDGCTGDSCATVEGAMYKTASVRLDIAPPALSSGMSSFLLIALSQADADLVPPAVAATAAAPPGLSRLWQFSLRAAASPRAPSFHS